MLETWFSQSDHQIRSVRCFLGQISPQYWAPFPEICCGNAPFGKRQLMSSIGRVFPIPVGKQLKMWELSSQSRAQAATSAYIYHNESPVKLSFHKIPGSLSRLVAGKGDGVAAASKPALRPLSSRSPLGRPNPYHDVSADVWNQVCSLCSATMDQPQIDDETLHWCWNIGGMMAISAAWNRKIVETQLPS